MDPTTSQLFELYDSTSHLKYVKSTKRSYFHKISIVW